MDFEDIIAYKRQKEQLIGNTLAFIRRRPANNVLLVGSRGTGKSSGVKALAKAYYTDGLRLIQMQKSQLSDLPKIMASRESTADISALHHGTDTCGHAADKLLLTANAAC